MPTRDVWRAVRNNEIRRFALKVSDYFLCSFNFCDVALLKTFNNK